MNIIRVRITLKSGEIWFASCPQTKTTPEKTVETLNRVAVAKNIGATYVLATESEYWHYRDMVRAKCMSINMSEGRRT